MDENKDKAPAEHAINPGVIEQLEQIKSTPDDTAARLLHFLVDNIKAIAIGCGAIIVAVGIYAGVNHWRANQALKAADSLGVLLIQKTDPRPALRPWRPS